MSDASATLSKDIGPLPAWAWGLIAGGAVVVFEWWRRLNSGASSSVVATSEPDDTPLDSSLNDLSASPDLTSTGTGTATGTILSNADWIAEAEQGLLNTGQDPIHILQALNDFINGNTLSTTEQGVVNAAIASYGLPPEGLNSGLSVAPPTTTTTAQTSDNNPTLAASRAAYDSTLAFLRSPQGKKLSPTDLANERNELNQQAAVYQAQLKALNPS